MTQKEKMTTEEAAALVAVANRQLACEGDPAIFCFIECEECIETRKARVRINGEMSQGGRFGRHP